MLYLLGDWKSRNVNLLETATEARQSADVRLYRRAAEVLEQVIVLVDPVQCGLTWKDLIEVREVVVEKMGEWLR
jgi:hypothetical protein